MHRLALWREHGSVGPPPGWPTDDPSDPRWRPLRGGPAVSSAAGGPGLRSCGLSRVPGGYGNASSRFVWSVQGDRGLGACLAHTMDATLAGGSATALAWHPRNADFPLLVSTFTADIRLWPLRDLWRASDRCRTHEAAMQAELEGGLLATAYLPSDVEAEEGAPWPDLGDWADDAEEDVRVAGRRRRRGDRDDRDESPGDQSPRATRATQRRGGRDGRSESRHGSDAGDDDEETERDAGGRRGRGRGGGVEGGRPRGSRDHAAPRTGGPWARAPTFPAPSSSSSSSSSSFSDERPRSYGVRASARRGAPLRAAPRRPVEVPAAVPSSCLPGPIEIGHVHPIAAACWLGDRPLTASDHIILYDVRRDASCVFSSHGGLRIVSLAAIDDTVFLSAAADGTVRALDTRAPQTGRATGRTPRGGRAAGGGASEGIGAPAARAGASPPPGASPTSATASRRLGRALPPSFFSPQPPSLASLRSFFGSPVAGIQVADSRRDSVEWWSLRADVDRRRRERRRDRTGRESFGESLGESGDRRSPRGGPAPSRRSSALGGAGRAGAGGPSGLPTFAGSPAALLSGAEPMPRPPMPPTNVLSMAVDDSRPWSFATGGTDGVVRVYDRRVGVARAAAETHAERERRHRHDGQRSRALVGMLSPRRIRESVAGGSHAGISPPQVLALAFGPGGDEIVASFAGDSAFALSLRDDAFRFRGEGSPDEHERGRAPDVSAAAIAVGRGGAAASQGAAHQGGVRGAFDGSGVPNQTERVGVIDVGRRTQTERVGVVDVGRRTQTERVGVVGARRGDASLPGSTSATGSRDRQGREALLQELRDLSEERRDAASRAGSHPPPRLGESAGQGPQTLRAPAPPPAASASRSPLARVTRAASRGETSAGPGRSTRAGRAVRRGAGRGSARGGDADADASVASESDSDDSFLVGSGSVESTDESEDEVADGGPLPAARGGGAAGTFSREALRVFAAAPPSLGDARSASRHVDVSPDSPKGFRREFSLYRRMVGDERAAAEAEGAEDASGRRGGYGEGGGRREGRGGAGRGLGGFDSEDEEDEEDEDDEGLASDDEDGGANGARRGSPPAARRERRGRGAEPAGGAMSPPPMPPFPLEHPVTLPTPWATSLLFPSGACGGLAPLLLTTGADGSVVSWDYSSARPLSACFPSTPAPLWSGSLCPGVPVLAAGTRHGVVRFFEPTAGVGAQGDRWKKRARWLARLWRVGAAHAVGRGTVEFAGRGPGGVTGLAREREGRTAPVPVGRGADGRCNVM